MYETLYQGTHTSITTVSTKLDYIKELDDEAVTFSQSWIGILRRIVELGRVDIFCEILILLSHLCLPREDHICRDIIYLRT